ncbi:hypothetical protein J6590_096875 [Homalodisca vitripennis]|nr:hypothetical protein J6590_096875 [Homalodisca vitripennis]
MTKKPTEKKLGSCHRHFSRYMINRMKCSKSLSPARTLLKWRWFLRNLKFSQICIHQTATRLWLVITASESEVFTCRNNAYSATYSARPRYSDTKSLCLHIPYSALLRLSHNRCHPLSNCFRICRPARFPSQLVRLFLNYSTTNQRFSTVEMNDFQVAS